MIISNSLGFILLHVPKCAGASLKDRLSAFIDPKRDILIRNNLPSVGTPLAVSPEGLCGLRLHSSLNQLYAVFGAKRLENFVIGSFARNPFARALSGYEFMKRRLGEETLPAKNRELFERWTQFTFDQVMERLDDISQEIGFFNPQVKWLAPGRKLDFLGRVETLQRDFTQFCDVINRPDIAAQPLLEINSSGGGARWRNMSIASARHIAKFYANDFEHFGYASDLGIAAGRIGRLPLAIDVVSPAATGSSFKNKITRAYALN